MEIKEKTYGSHCAKVEKVLNAYKSFSRNLGVILSGDKGIGKSLFAKQICLRALEEGYPVIVVDDCYPGIARFLDSIEQECVVLFDEFDKTYRSNRDRDDQAALLSVFDGTSAGKKLFIATCNELYYLNDYIVNRPGRFHYHIRFDYPTGEEIREYLVDHIDRAYRKDIDRVIEFSRKVSLNYDCLRAIAFEMNMGMGFAEAIADLNIMTTEKESYSVYIVFEDGCSLHNFNYSANLYDYDGTMSNIQFYNDDGKFVLTAYYDKSFVKYDAMNGKILIPAEGIKISSDTADLDYDDEEDEVAGKGGATFRGKRVQHMTFTKRKKRNLHYMI